MQLPGWQNPRRHTSPLGQSRLLKQLGSGAQMPTGRQMSPVGQGAPPLVHVRYGSHWCAMHTACGPQSESLLQLIDGPHFPVR